ncbi:DNA polymerase IV 1 [Pseudovibrio japonicus]|uniref:DNA polymerase IV n=1 Tax=Pseudovibrio japonicus TaxID=366534 RepID=A0ABQ3ENK4_9HYPH|nr:DNA polymerase IV [Pseudovibrio japonicus]GHB48454.1 DNA polymerase IV 1 [Pseudovibrio japonicus]
MATEATTPLKALCRDCTHRFRADLTRCPKCGSPRILAHAELDTLEIAHIDCDAFFASVEKRENPELADRPVIVGGGQRGVVSAACYIARIYGVRSAMPMFKALDLCPDAVVIKPRLELYSKVGKQIREEMEKLTPLVEPLSIDEAFLDLSGTQKLHGATPAEQLVHFTLKIQRELRLSVSVGLAPNKFLAKIASDLDKPRGFSVIGDAEKKEFLAKQPTSVIWGVGKVFQAKLERDGIKTIGQLQLKDPTDLARKYGAMGLRLAKLCQGEDDRHVSSKRGAKSISGETTFNSDISDVTQLSKSLWKLTEKVAYRTKKAEKSGRSVTLKLKTADFKTITRSRMLHDPTQLADKIFRTADELLKNVADGKMRFRLIGVGLGDLGPADQADPEDLLDEQAEKRAKVERAMDVLRGKFNDSSVVSLGRSLKTPDKT